MTIIAVSEALGMSLRHLLCLSSTVHILCQIREPLRPACEMLTMLKWHCFHILYPTKFILVRS